MKTKTRIVLLIVLSLTGTPSWVFPAQPLNPKIEILQKLLAPKPPAPKPAITVQKPQPRTEEPPPFIGPLPQTLQLNNSDPALLKVTLQALFPEVRIGADTRSRQLLAWATPEDWAPIKALAEQLDSPLARIVFEIEIVEVADQNNSLWKPFFNSLTDGFAINYDFESGKLLPLQGLQGALSQLITEGKAKVLAKPTVSTLDNSKSSIQVGDRVPYVTAIFQDRTVSQQVQYVDTGIALDITPKLNSKTTVLSNINATIINAKVWKEFGSGQYPVLATRKTDTTVQLENNQTLVIAGLLQEETKNNQTQIPFLADLPLVGGLFRGQQTETSRTDVLFLITPRFATENPSVI
ncbi:MAG: type II secretion system protein GspD [Candidatus Margulisiibacteriota bacterium]